MLVCKLLGRVEILMPKSRGAGFLKAPVGHHTNALTNFSLAYDFDFMGLDGSLEIWGALMTSLKPEEMETVIAVVVPALSAFTGFPFRMVDRTEFFEKHPIKNSTGY